jgi:molecular chaperone GrpE
MMKPDDQEETTFESGEAESGASNGSAGSTPVREDGQESELGEDASVEQLRAALEAAEKKAAENYESYLRERAELENFKKRSARDRAEALRYAAEPMARDLFGIVDNLERALEHARSSGDTSPVVAGVELVLKSAVETLGRHGIERIDATGQAFDPAVHEAVAQVPDDSVEPNHVVQQFLPGYRMHDRLLRAAQVTVSTGPKQS